MSFYDDCDIIPEEDSSENKTESASTLKDEVSVPSVKPRESKVNNQTAVQNEGNEDNRTTLQNEGKEDSRTVAQDNSYSPTEVVYVENEPYSYFGQDDPIQAIGWMTDLRETEC